MEGKGKVLGFESKTLSWLSYAKSNSLSTCRVAYRVHRKAEELRWKWATKEGQARKPVRRSWHRCPRWTQCYSARSALSNSIAITVIPMPCPCHPSFSQPGLYVTSLHIPNVFCDSSSGHVDKCLFASGKAPATDQEMVPSLCSLVSRWVLSWETTYKKVDDPKHLRHWEVPIQGSQMENCTGKSLSSVSLLLSIFSRNPRTSKIACSCNIIACNLDVGDSGRAESRISGEV